MNLLTAMRLTLIACLLVPMAGWAQNPARSPANALVTGQQPALKALIHSKAGDVYNDATVRRDFTTLWNTGRFDDIRLKTEKGERGGVIVNFVLTERP